MEGDGDLNRVDDLLPGSGMTKGAVRLAERRSASHGDEVEVLQVLSGEDPLLGEGELDQSVS